MAHGIAITGAIGETYIAARYEHFKPAGPNQPGYDGTLGKRRLSIKTIRNLGVMSDKGQSRGTQTISGFRQNLFDEIHIVVLDAVYLVHRHFIISPNDWKERSMDTQPSQNSDDRDSYRLNLSRHDLRNFLKKREKPVKIFR